ncbi:hypothetical protein Tco_1428293 [Tanacetum coccineum]
MMEVVFGKGKGVVIEEIMEDDEVNEASETGYRGQSLLLENENDVQTGNMDSTSKVDHPPWSFGCLSDSDISEHPPWSSKSMNEKRNTKRSEEFWFKIKLFENDLCQVYPYDWQQDPYHGDDEAEENAELFAKLDDLLEQLPFLNDELKENMGDGKDPRRGKEENEDERASVNVLSLDRKNKQEEKQMMEMQKFLSASNVVIECFKLLKELQDDELEKSREMMLQCLAMDRIPVALKGANIFYKNGIHPSYYSITFSLADNVPKKGGIVGDCGVWMVVVASVDNNAVVLRLFLLLASPMMAGILPSFKKRKHVVLDEGPSSPKSVPDIAPSDEACKTLFGSLASTEDPGDSDPFLPCIEEARSSRDALCNLSYPDVQRILMAQALSAEVFRLRGEVEALKDKLDFANQERTSLEIAMLCEVGVKLYGGDFVHLRLISYKRESACLDDNFGSVCFSVVGDLRKCNGSSVNSVNTWLCLSSTMTEDPPIVPFCSDKAKSQGYWTSLWPKDKETLGPIWPIKGRRLSLIQRDPEANSLGIRTREGGKVKSSLSRDQKPATITEDTGSQRRERKAQGPANHKIQKTTEIFKQRQHGRKTCNAYMVSQCSTLPNKGGGGVFRVWFDKLPFGNIRCVQGLKAAVPSVLHAAQRCNVRRTQKRNLHIKQREMGMTIEEFIESISKFEYRTQLQGALECMPNPDSA